MSIQQEIKKLRSALYGIEASLERIEAEANNIFSSGFTNGEAQGIKTGREQGRTEGYQDGYDVGFERGIAHAKDSD